jgi:asparagine synthase (glutamine-hydrolysing)
MCGICFIYHQNSLAKSAPPQKADERESMIRRMVNSLIHRGPDAQHHLVRGNVALGHTRLSIVDIRGGAQPMLSADGRYAIVYNGEIYNYQALRAELEQQGHVFNTESDTEVILNLYLRDEALCVHQLRGMFAFAIHDSKTNELFVARDRLGIKPLVYHWDGSTLYGASEIKSLFASGQITPRFNHQSLRNFFTYQFNLPPHTIFAGVVELPPGHTLTLTPGKPPQIDRYWDLQFPREGEYENLSEEQWLGEFDTALNDAVKTHMIGEVPIGAYLSGGVDSATTSYWLQQYYPQEVQAFTIRFSNTANDEFPIASNIAAHIGVGLHPIYMDDDKSDGFLDTLVDAIYSVEQPQRMALDIPLLMLSNLVRENGFKVVYTGEGADEILGGYDCYRQDYIRQWGNAKASQEERLKYYLSDFGNDFAADHLKMFARLHEPSMQQHTMERFGCYPAWFDFWHILEDSTEGLFTDAFLNNSAGHENQMSELIDTVKPHLQGLHPLNQSLYLETKTRLPGWILWRADRLAMANGVEARVPFLDHNLVELAAEVPPWLKLNGLDEKYILRKIMMPKLPEHPYYFKKRAFYTPIREWFFTPLNAPRLERFMSESKLREAGIFNPQCVRQLLDRLTGLPAPAGVNEYYRMMKLEWVLFLVLTMQILHELFVKQGARCFRDS